MSLVDALAPSRDFVQRILVFPVSLAYTPFQRCRPKMFSLMSLYLLGEQCSSSDCLWKPTGSDLPVGFLFFISGQALQPNAKHSACCNSSLESLVCCCPCGSFQQPQRIWLHPPQKSENYSLHPGSCSSLL